MKCSKVRYRNRVDALIALANIQAKDSPRRLKIERRAYRCPSCHAWHLTKLTKFTKKRKKGVSW